MAVTRTYLCDSCEYTWSKLHFDRDEPVPDCPVCAHVEARQIPGMFNITGVKAKAVDYAYKMAEADYGLTNMRDNTREGDSYVIPPPPVQTAEAEALAREMKEATGLSPEQAEMTANFWKSGSGGGGLPQSQNPAEQALIDIARASPPASDGPDPMAMLHKGIETGKIRTKHEVVARSKLEV